MNQLVEQFNRLGALHHLHILIGDRNKTLSDLREFCDGVLGNSSLNEADNITFIDHAQDRFLVEHSRSVIDRAILRTETGCKTIFCISFNEITPSAQNALLKIVEEPKFGTYFFLISPREDIFLPTILSRAIVIKIDNDDTDNSRVKEKSNQDYFSISELISMTRGDRIVWADKFAKKISDKKINRSEARKVVASLIRHLEKELKVNGSDAKTASVLKRLQRIDDYLGDAGSSVKILLEYAVLML